METDLVKHVAIAGGSRGLGKSLAIDLVKRGAFASIKRC